MSPKQHPYASFLDRVEKPSRYVGGEHGEQRKDASSVLGRMCLAFPDVYDIGMSHLGFKILYGILNGHEKLLAERCFAPWTDMEAELRKHGEVLRSLESARPLRDFDVVGFSLQFELTFSNVLLMLDLGGIPLRSADRSDDDPLILVGGPTSTHAEPLAPFFDAALIGDGEERTTEVLLTWSALKRAGMPRRERLREIAKLGGLYVPSLYETELEPKNGLMVVTPPSDPDLPFPVRRAFVEDLSRFPFPSGGPISATETIFDRVSVEIARGCTEGCRFCQAGMIYRPVRERTPESIVATISAAVRDGGYDEASLTSLSTADYSAINPLVRAVMKTFEQEKIALSVSSLRAYGLDEELLDEIRKVRATGLTFAPEAGSQRMRDVVNKNITEEQLMTTADRVFSRGWSKMKLYFMIGLPTEEEEDVRGIVQTAARAQNVGRQVQKGRPEVTASVSIHVPKPHTPFQWCAMDTKDQVWDKKGWLMEEARRLDVKLRMHPTDGSWLEGVLARGDRRLADVIEHAYRHGARFDSWEEKMTWSVWADAFEATGVDPSPYLATLPTSSRLPWDHIHVGLEDGFLVREYRKAVKSRLSPPCGKVAGMFVQHTNLRDAEADARKLVCYDCGVACDMTAMREERLVFLRTLDAHEPPPPRPERDRGQKVRPLHEARPDPVRQGRAARVRLAFRKVGRAVYRGHLDLVRVMPRIFRRIGMPVFYSQGFHPKPEMVFAPALSLGTPSLSELVDVRYDADRGFSIEDLAARLTAAADDGLEFFAAVPLSNDDPGVNKAIDETRYIVAIPHDVLHARGFETREAIDAHVAAKLAEESLVVVRSIEGLGKKIDVRRFLIDARVADEAEGTAALEAVGLVGSLVALSLRVRTDGSGSTKPLEIIEALFGDRELPHHPIRVALGLSTEDGGLISPLELDAVRQLRRQKRADERASDDAATEAVVASSPND